MKMGVGRTLFPAWSAAATLVREHGGDALQFALAAKKAPDPGTRLDAAIRAMTSFDHAIDSSRKLPVQWFIGGAGAYYRGYAAAKQAVTLLIASGVVPGARLRVGRQSLAAAKDAFLAGVDVARADRSRFGRHLASGWLEATAEDALAGAAMLRPGADVARALLSGIGVVRATVARRQPLDESLVRTVTELFDRAGSQLDHAIATAPVAPVTDARRYADVLRRSDDLLAQAAAGARTLLENTPSDAAIDARAHDAAAS